MTLQSFDYQVARLVFDAGQPYEKFRGRYEAAVPPVDPRPGDYAGRHVRWQDVAADGDGSGPHGSLYWRAEMTLLLPRSGELRDGGMRRHLTWPAARAGAWRR
jgi:hypothetical protein